MQKISTRICFAFLGFSIVSGCQNSVEPQQNTERHSQKIPIKTPQLCAQPALVHDIWKLEPILVKRGEINESMSREQKEKVIRAYIADKNAQYQICLKGSKKS